MKTGAGYLASLADGRSVYFEGRRVTDLNQEPLLRRAAQQVADTYDRYYSPEPGAVNPLMSAPATVEELRRSTVEREACDLLTGLTYQSLQTLLTVAGRMGEGMQQYQERIARYVAQAMADDVRIVECITDSKGDRALSPSKQPDPDAYVHVVERRASGVVIRGAKLHITGASLCHHLMVMPTKAMKANEGDYAIACIVDANAPGVRIVDVTPAPRAADDRHYPISRRSRIPTCLIMFDDVFVPLDRVMLDGETQYATMFAHALGLWTRLGSTWSMAEEADRLVGFAQLISDANGTSKIPHIKEKIADMIIHATLVRAGVEAAIYHAEVGPEGKLIPDELFTNAAKYQAAANYNLMLRTLHDIAGGSVITSPSMADFDNPDLHDFVEKYWAAAPQVEGEYRLRLFHAIRDYTADTFGAWQMVSNLHGAGGLYAQKIVSTKHYDMERAKAVALQSAGMVE